MAANHSKIFQIYSFFLTIIKKKHNIRDKGYELSFQLKNRESAHRLEYIFRTEKLVIIMLHKKMVIHSLYTGAEQLIIKRWIEQAPVYPERDDLNDANKVAEIALSSVQERLPQGS